MEKDSKEEGDAEQVRKEGQQEILEEFPLILRLLEGDLVKSEITISKEEQRAFEEIFSL